MSAALTRAEAFPRFRSTRRSTRHSPRTDPRRRPPRWRLCPARALPALLLVQPLEHLAHVSRRDVINPPSCSTSSAPTRDDALPPKSPRGSPGTALCPSRRTPRGEDHLHRERVGEPVRSPRPRMNAYATQLARNLARQVELLLEERGVARDPGPDEPPRARQRERGRNPSSASAGFAVRVRAPTARSRAASARARASTKRRNRRSTGPPEDGAGLTGDDVAGAANASGARAPAENAAATTAVPRTRRHAPVSVPGPLGDGPTSGASDRRHSRCSRSAGSWEHDDARARGTRRREAPATRRPSLFRCLVPATATHRTGAATANIAHLRRTPARLASCGDCDCARAGDRRDASYPTTRDTLEVVIGPSIFTKNRTFTTFHTRVAYSFARARLGGGRRRHHPMKHWSPTQHTPVLRSHTTTEEFVLPATPRTRAGMALRRSSSFAALFLVAARIVFFAAATTLSLNAAPPRAARSSVWASSSRHPWSVPSDDTASAWKCSPSAARRASRRLRRRRRRAPHRLRRQSHAEQKQRQEALIRATVVAVDAREPAAEREVRDGADREVQAARGGGREVRREVRREALRPPSSRRAPPRRRAPPGTAAATTPSSSSTRRDARGGVAGGLGLGVSFFLIQLEACSAREPVRSQRHLFFSSMDRGVVVRGRRVRSLRRRRRAGRGGARAAPAPARLACALAHMSVNSKA